MWACSDEEQIPKQAGKNVTSNKYNVHYIESRYIKKQTTYYQAKELDT